MVILQTIFALTILIGLLVFVHELGHFTAAKISGIKVEEFAFGFWKKLIGKKIGETLYRINLVPLGGYVKLLGEEKKIDDPRSFSSKPYRLQSFVLLAGVIMNFILGCGLFFIMLASQSFSNTIPYITDHKFIGAESKILEKPIVEETIPDSPASKADFPSNIIIWEINYEKIVSLDQFIEILDKNAGNEVVITYSDFNGTKTTQTVNLSEEDPKLGVKFNPYTIPFYELNYQNTKYISGFLHSVNFMTYSFDSLAELIKISFEEKTIEPVTGSVTGIVGVSDRTYTLIKVKDVNELLNLAASVSLSLALMNILPIPLLDGGHLFFITLERIRGRKLAEKYEKWSIRCGLFFLIALTVLVTFKDIVQFDIIGRLFNKLTSLF